MAKTVLDEALWKLIKPILPEPKRPSRYGGRPPLSNRKALTGILYVLRTGIPFILWTLPFLVIFLILMRQAGFTSARLCDIPSLRAV